MKNIKSLPFVWLPLLTLWTIILVLFKDLSVNDIEVYVPLVIYLPISFIFSTQYGLLISDKREFLFTKLSSSSSIIVNFLISTISIFSYIYGYLDFQRSLLFISLPLVANLIINEFISISNKKLASNMTQWKKRNLEIEDEQIQRSKDNAISRQIYISNKEKWKTFLRESLTKYSKKEDIVIEIKRILSIVEYSSYFREDLSIEELINIQSSDDLSLIKNTLERIK